MNVVKEDVFHTMFSDKFSDACFYVSDMADKLDMAIIALRPTKSDLEALEPILRQGFYPEPNMVYHIYKNREDEYVNVKLWLYADMGTLRTTDLFLTNSDYEPIPIEAVNIQTYNYDTEEEQNEEEIA